MKSGIFPPHRTTEAIANQLRNATHMIFQQFRHEEGGCLSYLLGCTKTGVCVVIDPQLTIELYDHYASSHNIKITHIIETHAHADHLSGAKELSQKTGATVYFHEASEAAFPSKKVKDGDDLAVGNIHLKVVHTPGHTADSISLVVSDRARSPEPWFVLTGDALFVGDTGRPDLDGNAEVLYDSIWKKLLTLPDSVEVYPGHFAGSACGKSMSPKPSSTIGFERKFNPSLQTKSKKEFVDLVMSDLPVQPPRFQKVRQYNLGFLQQPPIEKTYDMKDLQITVKELKQRIDRGEKILVLDVREPSEFETANMGGMLIPLSELGKRYSELDPNQEIVVHCHHGGRSQRAVEFLYGRGFKNVKNLMGGIDAWSKEVDPKVPRY